MNEDEKMAIDYLQTHIIPYLKNGNIKFLVNEVILNLIEKQEKKIEELKVINNMQKYRIEVIDERELIPKLKIDEKIKELEKQVEVEDGIGLRYSEKGKIYAQIKILKELKENKNE